MIPIKTIRDSKPSFLESLARSYQEMGYTIQHNKLLGILELYPKGSVIQKTDEELTIEKWTN